MKWLRRVFKPRLRRKEANRVASLRAVRIDKRVRMPGFEYDYGDFNVNKEQARKLREQAQKKDG